MQRNNKNKKFKCIAYPSVSWILGIVSFRLKSEVFHHQKAPEEMLSAFSTLQGGNHGRVGLIQGLLEHKPLQLCVNIWAVLSIHLKW